MTSGIMNLREHDTAVSLSCIIRSCVLGSDHQAVQYLGQL